MKLSSLSKTSVLLVVCFGADKILAILRQLIIARTFGLGHELDVFNIANNLPDMLFILISGGAMAMVVIPVLTDVIKKKSLAASWRVFSSILNLTFLASFVLSLLIWFFAETIVTSEFGIAPGFSPAQQADVVSLMRLNLIATLIFSISGLMIGALQSNQRFLLPALAPLFYNVGQIFGAVVLAPTEGASIFGLSIPTFGLGIHGLAYGVILGAVLHLLIQVPGLIQLGFRWIPVCELHEPNVRRMLRILVPRILTVFFVQLIFIFRDNLASRLTSGSVTALSYGYMFQQLPETLIGTALGTALLPSLSIFIADGKRAEFEAVFTKALRLVVALTFGSAVIMGLGLGPLASFALDLSEMETSMLVWTLAGFLAGLTGHCLLEVTNRSFYAQQDAFSPLLATILNFILFITFGLGLYQTVGVAGISLSDSIAFTAQALLLIFWLKLDPVRRSRILSRIPGARIFGELGESNLERRISIGTTFEGWAVVRAAVGALVSASILWLVVYSNLISLPFLNSGTEMMNLVKSLAGIGLAIAVYVPFVLPEIRLLKNF